MMTATPQDIQRLAERIVEKFRPEQVVLFGSHACGVARDDSDVDLLVVMAYTGSRSRHAASIRAALPASIPIDVVVRTPEEVRGRLSTGDPLILDALENGKVLYAAAA